MSFTQDYLHTAATVLDLLDAATIERVVDLIVKVRSRRGRVFFLGVGGGAGNANHAVNDFRKIAGVEAYAPTDNTPELTARINDEGWYSCFSEWLRVSQLNEKDLVFVFSVGGGSLEHQLSVNIVTSLNLARQRGAAITGIVGRDGGETARLADACVIVPTVAPEHVTALTESFQALIWHLIVTHPSVKQLEMRWESTENL